MTRTSPKNKFWPNCWRHLVWAQLSHPHYLHQMMKRGVVFGGRQQTDRERETFVRCYQQGFSLSLYCVISTQRGLLFFQRQLYNVANLRDEGWEGSQQPIKEGRYCTNWNIIGITSMGGRETKREKYFFFGFFYSSNKRCKVCSKIYAAGWDGGSFNPEKSWDKYPRLTHRHSSFRWHYLLTYTFVLFFCFSILNRTTILLFVLSSKFETESREKHTERFRVATGNDTTGQVGMGGRVLFFSFLKNPHFSSLFWIWSP